MKHTIFLLFLILNSLFTSFSCRPPKRYDLALTNVKLFDAVNKVIREGQTILINADTIADIISADIAFNSISTIDGKGKLVTPGFIDTHIHLTDLLGDYQAAPEYIHKDSVAVYRKRIANTYLANGVTTVKEAGCPENWINETITWQQQPASDFPNFYTCGGALISDEERTPYISHLEVKDPAEAIQKIEEYCKKGLKFIKLYSRLRMPEMKACMKRANELNLNVCAHFEWQIPIDTALTYGVRHFEHAFTLSSSVLDSDVTEKFNLEYRAHYQRPLFFPMMFEQFNFIARSSDLKKKLDTLIKRMAATKATLSTATHLFASQINRSYFSTPLHPGDAPETFNAEQTKRMNLGFDLMMSTLKEAHNKGVTLCIGTDCMDGGKAALSEMLLFYEAGFSTADILQIATYNGAISMDLTKKYGSIETGKKADLLIFEENPFDNYKNFLSKKTVIKDGRIFGS